MYTIDRLDEIWRLLPSLSELTGDARAYYGACTDPALQRPRQRSNEEVARELGWTTHRVQAAVESLTEIIGRYY
jgi:hypothetical protein